MVQGQMVLDLKPDHARRMQLLDPIAKYRKQEAAKPEAKPKPKPRK